jgi:prolyl oligopeptidase
VHDLSTGEKKGRIGANLIGSFAQLTGRRHHTEIFFQMLGFSNPGLIYRYSLKNASQGAEKLWRSTVVKGLKPEEFSTEQVFYTSKDGTRVPMFIVNLSVYTIAASLADC